MRQTYLSNAGFRSIHFEYPQEELDWPALLVQFRPNTVQWVSLAPDLSQDVANWPADDKWEGYNQIRQGRFEGSVELEVLALTAAERDRLWDQLVALTLMGRINPDTKVFYDEIENGDLVKMLIQDSRIDPVGSTVSMGTPWGTQELVYEASLRLNCLGEFYADLGKRELVAISAVEVYVADEERLLLTEDEESEWPSGDDGEGEWQ